MLVEIEGLAFGVFLLIIVIFKKRKITIPKGYFWLLLFCLVQIPYVITYKGAYSFHFIILFASGALFLLTSHNLKEFISPIFSNLLVVLGGFLGILYIVCRYIFDPFKILENSQLLYTNSKYVHVHIGDLFAVVSIILLPKLLKQKKLLDFIAMIASLIFVVISFSRSAIVSIMAGVIYLISYSNKFLKYRKILIFTLVAGVTMFLVGGVFKPVITNRLYYYQAIYAFIKHPLGIGMGNFSKLFDYGINHSVNSNFTHNLWLETLVGVGILSLPFFIWTYVIVKELSMSIKYKYLIYRLITLVILINFTFDTTYVIPLMFWVLFVSIGLVQSGKG